MCFSVDATLGLAEKRIATRMGEKGPVRPLGEADGERP